MQHNTATDSLITVDNIAEHEAGPTIIATEDEGLPIFGTRSSWPDFAQSALTPQISRAYSLTVRSDENLPMRATFRMEMRFHSSGWR